MSKWDPQSDLMQHGLMRLLGALGDEIAASTDREVAQACHETRWPLAQAAKEVRDLIDAANGDPGKLRIDPFAAPAEGGFDLDGSQPHRNTSETGNRTCQRQH